MRTRNRLSEQSTIEKRSTYSVSSSTYSFGDSERSEATAPTNKPLRSSNMPLDNLSPRPLSDAGRSLCSIEANFESTQKIQPVQILVPSALDLNAPLQPSLPRLSVGSENRIESDVGNSVIYQC